ncbi:MAG: excalibur calcium-binding domain-containing protein [Segniliparus sp.]|uniref:excalibur calcium-binding domain-containing protein n=1 Tax=Segniliparus sp. TaxID=2804064 RepID=UPI003F3B09D3
MRKLALAALVLGPVAPFLLSPEAWAGPPYRSCAEARADGAAPLYRGDPGYSSKLDRDGDGVACETGGGSRSSSGGRGSVPSVPTPALPTSAPMAPFASTSPPTTSSSASPAGCSAPVLGAPCCNAERHIFGKDASGQEFFCVYPENPSAPPQWNLMSATFIGVQERGAPCSSRQNYVAETAIGVPLFCTGADNIWKSVTE